MDYLQYAAQMIGMDWNDMGVLNLIINGLPSILTFIS